MPHGIGVAIGDDTLYGVPKGSTLVSYYIKPTMECLQLRARSTVCLQACTYLVRSKALSKAGRWRESVQLLAKLGARNETLQGYVFQRLGLRL